MNQKSKIILYTFTHCYLFKKKISKLVNIWHEYIKFCKHANKEVKAALKKEFKNK